MRTLADLSSESGHRLELSSGQRTRAQRSRAVDASNGARCCADGSTPVWSHNTLHIVFHSPFNTFAAVAAKLPYIIPGTGYEPIDPSKGIYPTSQYVRKAAYSFGWDWAPRLITSGIWLSSAASGRRLPIRISRAS